MKNDAWFLEKYDPELREQNDKLHNAMVRSTAEKFFQDVREGKYQNLNLITTETVDVYPM